MNDEHKEGFGIQYNFSLLDSGDAAAVDAPEWIVPLGKQLEALAADHGLTVELCQNFHEYFANCMQESTFW